MKIDQSDINSKRSLSATAALVGMLIFMLTCPFNIFSATPIKPVRPPRRPATQVTELPDSIVIGNPIASPAEVVVDSLSTVEGNTTAVPIDTLDVIMPPDLVADAEARETEAQEREYIFNPDATRAVWLSALCPGLGQLYNRR